MRLNPIQTPPETIPGAQLVTHTARVLKALAVHQEHGARVADLVEHTRLERATVNRITRALCLEGLAMRRDDGPRYVLGPLAFELGLAAGRHHPLRELAAESMARIGELTGDTCFLRVRSGRDAVCIDRREGSFPVKALTISVGDRRPIGASAASLALLMHLPEHEREALILANSERIRRYGMLTAGVTRAMLAKSLELGFALNNNNIIPDVSAVGVAIPARFGPPFAALSVSALSSRMMPGQRFRKIVRWLEAEARQIASALTNSTT